MSAVKSYAKTPYSPPLKITEIKNRILMSFHLSPIFLRVSFMLLQNKLKLF